MKFMNGFFSATISRPFSAVLPPFCRAARLPGAKTERTGEILRREQAGGGAGVRIELRFDTLCLGISVAALAFRHPVQNPPKFSPNGLKIWLKFPKFLSKFLFDLCALLACSTCSVHEDSSLIRKIVVYFSMNQCEFSPSRPRRIVAISSCSQRSCSART